PAARTSHRTTKHKQTRMNTVGFGIHLLGDLGERDLDILLTCPQELHQPRDERVVDPLRLSVLFVGLIERDAAALRGRLIDVPVEGVAARKEVPAPFAEGDLQRVRLRRVAVPLEVFPCPERRVGTAPALDLANRATCPVSLRGCEQRLVPRLELSRELEVLVLRFLLLLLLLLLMLLLRRWLLLH
ncbi:hypothetical protein DFH94DRAFT_770909, partial [Russula ochroleuca]